MTRQLTAALSRAERSVKLALCALLLLSCAGWGTTVIFASYIVGVRAQAISAERELDAARASVDFYRKSAAKAYTQMLISSDHTVPGRVPVPTGTRVDCEMTYTQIAGRTVGHCEGLLLLPPPGYVN
jgi:hypothetical protein